MARERGVDVDVSRFGKLMDEQRERARKAQKKRVIELASDIGFAGSLEGRKIPGHEISATKFLGYDFLETEAVVETVLAGNRANEINVVLDQTPCYAEMGGQVGDRGLLHVPGHDRPALGEVLLSGHEQR